MNKKDVISNLSEFISIQSVSSDSRRFSEILKAVTFLQEKLRKLGFSYSALDLEGYRTGSMNETLRSPTLDNFL